MHEEGERARGGRACMRRESVHEVVFYCERSENWPPLLRFKDADLQGEQKVSGATALRVN